jgi:hypothetical protein
MTFAVSLRLALAAQLPIVGQRHSLRVDAKFNQTANREHTSNDKTRRRLEGFSSNSRRLISLGICHLLLEVGHSITIVRTAWP